MKITETIFVCLAAILTIYTTYSWNDTGIAGKLALIVGILASVFVAINSFKQHKKERLIEKVNTKIGEISHNNVAKQPKISVGGSDSYLLITGTGIFGLDLGNLFKINVIKNKFHFWCIIRSKTGEPVAVIDDNVWTVFDDNYEYNNDDNGFELVTKAERIVYFQIDYKNHSFVSVAGMVINKAGRGFYFAPAPEYVGGGGLLCQIFPDKEFNLEEVNLKKLFKYPREKFLGIRDC